MFSRCWIFLEALSWTLDNFCVVFKLWTGTYNCTLLFPCSVVVSVAVSTALCTEVMPPFCYYVILSCLYVQESHLSEQQYHVKGLCLTDCVPWPLGRVRFAIIPYRDAALRETALHCTHITITLLCYCMNDPGLDVLTTVLHKWICHAGQSPRWACTAEHAPCLSKPTIFVSFLKLPASCEQY